MQLSCIQITDEVNSSLETSAGFFYILSAHITRTFTFFISLFNSAFSGLMIFASDFVKTGIVRLSNDDILRYFVIIVETLKHKHMFHANHGAKHN